MNLRLYEELKELLLLYNETYKKYTKALNKEKNEEDHVQVEFLSGDLYRIKDDIFTLFESCGRNPKKLRELILKLLEELCPNAHENLKDLSGKQFVNALVKLNTKKTDNFYFVEFK